MFHAWEARWGYFLVIVFLFTLPAQLAVVRQEWLAGGALALLLFPLLHFWETQFWPTEQLRIRRAQDRTEAAQWRDAASALRQEPSASVLAPWWLSPETAYWSGQPLVAGSSHESLPGIVASARFFVATSADEAETILRQHKVGWVFASDGERTVENSAAILGGAVPARALGRVLDQFPSQAPLFLVLDRQNGACKVYRVRN